METGCIVVLDVGKTNAKLTLWGRDGGCLARRVRANASSQSGPYATLDLDGVEAWAKNSLRDYATLEHISAIVPVTHGAAAALIHNGRLFAPPLDYEAEIPTDILADYDRQRDAFVETGSPSLPQGLNLGAQLHFLESLTGPWPADMSILLWPQYWAWRLSGVMASEVTSLGCHTDLWQPLEGRPSNLAQSRGWAGRLGPLRKASDVLGVVTEEWVTQAGLPPDCLVLCGLHDSNAALLAARGHDEISASDATILSTGTWFVAMRSLALGKTSVEAPRLEERRDCLVNVDVAGRPVPSARFMGGRESELIAGLDTFNLTANYDPASLIAVVPEIIRKGVMVLPTFAPGFGPFPDQSGQWINEVGDAGQRRSALGLYLALMADVVLDLIGSKERLLVEGRFAEAEVFIRALATLRPMQSVYVSNAHDDVPYGALRLILPELKPMSALRSVAPLDVSLDSYRTKWRAAIAGADQ